MKATLVRIRTSLAGLNDSTDKLAHRKKIELERSIRDIEDDLIMRQERLDLLRVYG
jgi:hypothetical protein